MIGIKEIFRIARRTPRVVPATEPLNHVIRRDLMRGSSYLVKEQRAELCFEIFVSLVKGRCTNCQHLDAFPCESIGCERCTLPCTCKECKNFRAQGLCFTINSPMEVRLRYALQTTLIFWISSHGPENVSPTNLEMIANIISKFLKKSRNPVVLLDGIEHMILSNGSVPVLRFLRDVEEKITMYNAIFILPINPKAVGEKELALMERTMKEIDAKDEEYEWLNGGVNTEDEFNMFMQRVA
ncbi:MAG: hypothetical protein A4E44_01054 [Methanosaeta sp. PtaB.Bin018]|jgi:hypothetical protein|nr:MAG: hypothetical protein A4E44_01054 [Methanosaeta sp. PtaB.Bin018]